MSIPTPADLAPRVPAGGPGGGQFARKDNAAPSHQLAAGEPFDDFDVPELVDEVDQPTAARVLELDAAYMRLWQRLNAKHRRAIYADAARLADQSTDPAELAILSQLAAPGIPEKVARNPATPASVLHAIAVGSSDTRSREARQEAVAHRNCDPATIRVVWAHRRVLDHAGQGASAVATAPNTPGDIAAAAREESGRHFSGVAAHV